jgi:DedD protein
LGVPEPRTHYQLSFTAKQGMAFFVLCLLALGASFFFGLMAGLTGRSSPAAASATLATPVPVSIAPSPAETPEASEAPSETRIAGEAGNLPPANAPTAPAVLQAFEDRGADEPTPVPTSKHASAPAAAPASGTWIQVASLGSRSEAEALAGRLTRHGFKAQAAPAQGPKGTVFRVRVGPYRSEPEASRAAERLRRQEKIAQTWIVTEGR